MSVAADAHFPAHPPCLSAGELAVEAETALERGNDYSIRECVITFPLLCILPHPAKCYIFVFLIYKMRELHISRLGQQWHVSSAFLFTFFFFLDASVCHVKTISQEWTCSLTYQMSYRILCGCTVEQSRPISPPPHPSISPLWRKRLQLLLAIVVPLQSLWFLTLSWWLLTTSLFVYVYCIFCLHVF